MIIRTSIDSISANTKPATTPTATPITSTAATPDTKADTEPPKIRGVKNLTVFIGDRVSYKTGVSVKDNHDTNVALVVDTGGVNLKKAGVYNITYMAKDAAGNVVQAEATVTVKVKPTSPLNEDELNKLADTVLAKIMTEDMTEVDKLWAIFKWTKYNIGYIDSSSHTDWRKGALQGFKQGTGDCFVFYATARTLMERSGFETQTVIRDKGRKTKHFWSLVKVEDAWYHFDTTPTIKKNTTFLLTDAELALFNKQFKNYYLFDKTKHPATPTKPLKERSKYLK
ncbi:transglutaminase domain-containing protein [Paenibacillus sp. VMFN-D1]|uniref:transglutaminase domain-containing protein n=1 Tax=Paenibacillus sp. VMFN-D1 TaxID=2135608 RepID=UPI001C6E5C5D|nr:transglutaminase domain-containing protein [Paenibacillus sp. VMFN-D1]